MFIKYKNAILLFLMMVFIDRFIYYYIMSPVDENHIIMESSGTPILAEYKSKEKTDCIIR